MRCFVIDVTGTFTCKRETGRDGRGGGGGGEEAVVEDVVR